MLCVAAGTLWVVVCAPTDGHVASVWRRPRQHIVGQVVPEGMLAVFAEGGLCCWSVRGRILGIRCRSALGEAPLEWESIVFVAMSTGFPSLVLCVPLPRESGCKYGTTSNIDIDVE